MRTTCRIMHLRNVRRYCLAGIIFCSLVFVWYGALKMFYKGPSAKHEEVQMSRFREGKGARSGGGEKTADKQKTSTRKCVHPQLDPFDPTVMQHLGTFDPVSCDTAMKDWVYVRNGTFHISQEARHQQGDITCDYVPLIRKSDFEVENGTPISPMPDGAALTSDFFRVNCKSSQGHKYTNIHAGVAWYPAIHERLNKKRSERAASENVRGQGQGQGQVSNSLGLNVFIFGFDSTSRMAWIRNLPKTREYFLYSLGGVELEGYNIVGDGTPAALLPILTGMLEEELPETRRGHPGAQQVDIFPWVWNDFSRHGYVTVHAEDMQNVGTFQYRLLGFKDQPTDHHMRTFYLEAQKVFRGNLPGCLGSVPRHLMFMNWFRELFTVYKDHPKLFFGFHSEYSHSHSSRLKIEDSDLAAFLQDLEKEGHLNSTLLILMSDHGARFQELRATKQGGLEERMPYFAFRFPPWFRKRHPELIKNFETNTHRLTTPFDIHATLHDILNYTGPGVADISHRGVSLFKEIPANRTCSDAGIAPHWCACLDWQPVDTADRVVRGAAQAAVDAINSYTAKQRAACVELKLEDIKHGVVYVPTENERNAEKVMKKYLVGDKMQAEMVSEYNLTLTGKSELFRVTFVTQPGSGLFEVTCTHDVTADTFNVNGKAISRINMYGSAPDCVASNLPHLRPYCYCVHQ